MAAWSEVTGDEEDLEDTGDTVDTVDMVDMVDMDTATEEQASSMKFPITVQLTLRYRSSISKNF